MNFCACIERPHYQHDSVIRGLATPSRLLQILFVPWLFLDGPCPRTPSWLDRVRKTLIGFVFFFLWSQCSRRPQEGSLMVPTSTSRTPIPPVIFAVVSWFEGETWGGMDLAKGFGRRTVWWNQRSRSGISAREAVSLEILNGTDWPGPGRWEGSVRKREK